MMLFGGICSFVAVYQSMMSHRGSIFDLLLDFRDAHEPSQWQDRRSQTRCQTVCEIRLLAETISDAC